MKRSAIRRKEGWVTSWLASRLSLVDSLRARLELFMVPSQMLSDGSVDDRAVQKRYLRVVGILVLACVAFFAPSLVLAGVPTREWPAFLVGVVLAACVISWSLLFVRAHAKTAILAAAADAVVIAGLIFLLRDYYHQGPLLLALVVAGHTTINGLRAAMVAVAFGSVLVPLALTVDRGFNATDPVYALAYLSGIVTVVWIADRLSNRVSSAVRASESKYRLLVERVPAIVYTAGFGHDAGWQYVSPGVEGLLGFPTRAWTSDPGFWRSRVHPDDRDRVLARETESWRQTAGTRSALEYRMIHRDGRVRWVSDEAAVVASEDGSRSYWSGFLTDITVRKELEQQLQHQAFHDPLTGLANRALFADRVEHALTRSTRRSDSLAVLFLDLDDFKTVNDGMGHEAGDELLVLVAQAVQSCLRSTDTAARLGGDEFAVLLEDLPTARGASRAAERILTALSHPFAVREREVIVGASIGIARPTTGQDGAAELLRNADSAMYAAKRMGKGRHETYEPAMHAAAVQRLELSAEIRRALKHGEFRVYYQPTVLLHDGSIAGFEALVRWNHPLRGLVLPSEFIQAAEQTGQIIPIGRLVLNEACRQARIWRDAFPADPARSMSVNVSGRQFRDASLAGSVGAAIAAAGIDPRSLILEVTESVVMEDSEAALTRLHALKAIGVRLAIDDFGTGYSSLSSLRRLPFDILKVDKSFVDGIASNSEAFAFARVIVRMGQTLHLETVAEGVELPSQAAALRRMGCGFGQGFHFARPMSADAAATMLLSAADGQRLAG